MTLYVVFLHTHTRVSVFTNPCTRAATAYEKWLILEVQLHNLSLKPIAQNFRLKTSFLQN